MVGTGGAGLYSFGAPLANSQVRHDGSWGVLELAPCGLVRLAVRAGYLVFDWRWPDRAPGLWLAGRPELQGQLADENAWP